MSLRLSRRLVCGGLALAPVAGWAVAAPPRWNARVLKRGGTHSSLAAALADAPPGAGPYRILLGRGRWEEKLTIGRPGVEIVGEDRASVRLVWSDSSGAQRAGGGTFGTYGSATLAVEAPDVTLRNLTVENGFDYEEHRRTGGSGGQAVALLLGRRSDRALIDGVDIVGHQDSFYLHSGRALVRGCMIAGGVDFIFGGAAALFEACELRSRLRAGEPIQGYVAAPSTPRMQRFGLVFDRCRLTREPLVPDGSVFLGRPWRAGGNVQLVGAAAYLRCHMDAHIHPEGWAPMHYAGPNGYRMTFQPGDARFAEFVNSGPGSRPHRGRPRLTGREAARYTADAILGGWRPV